MINRHYANISLILIPVIICVAIFFSPPSFQEPLVQKLDSLTFWNWFTYIFVHQNLQHLMGNITIYLVAILTAYLSAPKQDKNKIVSFTWFILIIVPLLTLIMKLFLREFNLFPLSLVNSKGFSGISAASLGLLAFSISRRIQLVWAKNFRNDLLMSIAYLIFFPCLGFFSLQLSWKLGLSCFLVWIILIWLIAKGLKKSERSTHQNNNMNNLKRELFYLGTALAILFLSIPSLAPKNIVFEGTLVDVLSHLMGFVISFWIPLFITKIARVRMKGYE